MSDWKPGDPVSWWYVPRSGYGFGYWVPATVVRVTPKRVVIRALRADRTWRAVRVHASRLKPRTTAVPEDDATS